MPGSPIIRPLLGRRNGRSGRARFLLVCWYDPHGIATVYENIALWQRLSEFELQIVNLWPTRGDRLCLPEGLDLNEYHGIVLHATVSYAFDNLEALDSQLARPFEQYDLVKVLMKQDEQRMPARFAEYLGRKRFDLLLTCVPEGQLPKFIPARRSARSFLSTCLPVTSCRRCVTWLRRGAAHGRSTSATVGRSSPSPSGASALRSGRSATMFHEHWSVVPACGWIFRAAGRTGSTARPGWIFYRLRRPLWA